jgi:hypothetical protein
MPTDKMTVDERRKYLRTMKKRYGKASRKEKKQLLDEMEIVTGQHRKSLIRLLNSSLERKPRSRERGIKYGPEVDDALRVIYESLDYICAERLTPSLGWMATHLAEHGELEVTPGLLEQLEQISISTVERRLCRIRQDQPRLPRKKPRPRNKKLREIPMLRLPWNLGEPGHFEADLVHHSGPTISGEYVYTLQMVDVATGWSERRAVLGRSYRVMQAAFRSILAHLPFPVLQIHPDNGGEFFSDHMLRFWDDKVQGITLSRSRPYHKNDNPRIEQKNSTLVRAYLGHDRLDSVCQVVALNKLYDNMGIYYNLFQPVMHLVEKEFIPQDGKSARIRRRHDQAQTPFQRLCQTNAILPEHREQLCALRDSINPRLLRREIYADLAHLFTLPSAVPGVTEDIHQTLACYQEKCVDSLFPVAFQLTTVEA